MYLIGLTGGIASGKSTVSRMLSELGAFIVDADKLSREVTQPGKPAWQEIIEKFGQDIVQDNGEIDRKHLGQLVFANKQARSELEEITHPHIEAAAKAAMAAASAGGFAVVVLDAPLLIEVGWHTRVDAVWVVYVNEQTQLKRLMARDNSGREAAQARINAQLSLTEKLKYADVVINNGDAIEITKKNVQKAWKEIDIPH
ncbi:dephospho-CoA kinase [Sporomusa sp. KB1]|jgi:dephospho-CoA kinase|uniref:dephospho-CoA kinase n=1 Tax=Sporomusa sp. KB1 TaxID=943346 RepID=UPI0011AA74D8|nr:dephospho-CoA kinase [Sporomusa sp. KB1]TWH49374.1 dephospho-CoA kinase [Sporomusa sp. KB1]